jgi:predicted Zn-dependent peptidase
MFQKTTLDNGLRILTQAMPHTRSVSALFLVGVGSRYEADTESGTTHFIEHMVFKGTDKRPTAHKIAEAIEGVGGIFGAGTGRETTVFWAKVAELHLPIALDVLVDMLRNARFDAKELDREAQVIIEEINLSLDTPSDLVHMLAYDQLWPGHPLGRDIAGTRESVVTLKRDALLDYMARHYGPNRTVISLAGNLEHEDVVARLVEYLGDWQPTDAISFASAPDSHATLRFNVHSRETEQAQVRISVPGLPLSHPDRFVLRLLNTVLGGGMSSRLFQEIRERRGLAYSVDAFAEALLDTGVVGMYAGVSPEQATTAVSALLAEWDRLRQEPVSEDELHKAREYLKGRMLLALEDSAAYASWWGRQEVRDQPLESPDEVVSRLDAVTPEAIQSLSQTLFQEDKLNLVVLGPFQSETPFLSALRL